jgi:hypothetical protein
MEYGSYNTPLLTVSVNFLYLLANRRIITETNVDTEKRPLTLPFPLRVRGLEKILTQLRDPSALAGKRLHVLHPLGSHRFSRK